MRTTQHAGKQTVILYKNKISPRKSIPYPLPRKPIPQVYVSKAQMREWCMPGFSQPPMQYHVRQNLYSPCDEVHASTDWASVQILLPKEFRFPYPLPPPPSPHPHVPLPAVVQGSCSRRQPSWPPVPLADKVSYQYRLVGLVVRRPPRQRKIPGSNPACAGIFVGVESYQ